MTFISRFILLIVPMFCIFSNPAFAMEESDISEIQGIIHKYTDAWNYHEGKGFGNDFTEDADFVNIFGMYFSGRVEIEERHVQILQNFLKGSHLKITDLNLREVQSGLVIAIVRWNLDGFRNPRSNMSQPGEKMDGIFTQVLIKSDGQWKITASQNTVLPNR